MRRVLFLLFAAGFLIVGCSKAPPVYESNYTAPPASPSSNSNSGSQLHIAIIGDFYTRGSDLGGEGNRNWTVLATDQLRHEGLNVEPAVAADRNSGYAKAGSNGILFATQVPIVVRPDDRLVVFFGSVNDAHVPASDLSAAFASTVAKVRAVAPKAQILAIGPPWLRPSLADQLADMTGVLRSESLGLGVTFVDPIGEGWFSGRPELIGADGVHPTNAGHRLMADKIAPLIAEKLRANSQ